MVDFVTNDTGSKLRITAKDKETGAVIDLTGATVYARWEDALGVMQTKVMAITNATGGVAEYQLLTGEIVYPFFKVEYSITDSGGFVISNLNLERYDTREELG